MSQTSIQLAGAEHSVLHFSGSPRGLVGNIPVVNISAEKQGLQNILIRAEKLRSTGGAPFGEVPFRARLRGGQEATLPARLPLDPTTPPGRYEFAVTIGARTLPAVAHVPEVVDLRIEPRVITILAGHRSSSYTRTLICENRGNVVLLGGSRCEVPVFEDTPAQVAILNGLSKGDRRSIRCMVKAALDELADLKVGTMVITRKPMALAPGEKVSVEIGIELPPDLKPQHHYSTGLHLYNAFLTLEVYTTAKPEGSSSTT